MALMAGREQGAAKDAFTLDGPDGGHLLLSPADLIDQLSTS